MSADYILRQIEDMTRWLATVVLAKRPGTVEIMDEAGCLTGEYLLLHEVRELLAAGEVNAAEDLLFEVIREDPRDEYLPVALEFYDQLKNMSDAMLAARRFSRAEVAEGLAAIAALYGKGPDAV
ncbi:MAG: DUF6483 family protein [Oscillospiraceae bacterium]